MANRQLAAPQPAALQPLADRSNKGFAYDMWAPRRLHFDNIGGHVYNPINVKKSLIYHLNQVPEEHRDSYIISLEEVHSNPNADFSNKVIIGQMLSISVPNPTQQQQKGKNYQYNKQQASPNYSRAFRFGDISTGDAPNNIFVILEQTNTALHWCDQQFRNSGLLSEFHSFMLYMCFNHCCIKYLSCYYAYSRARHYVHGLWIHWY